MDRLGVFYAKETSMCLDAHLTKDEVGAVNPV